MPTSPIAYAGWAFMVAVVAYTLWVGRKLERAAAVLTAAGWLLVGVLQDADMRHVPWASCAVDAVIETAFVAIAVVSGRPWAAFLAGFQLLNLSSYLAYAFDGRLFQRAFITLSYLWSAGVLASLGSGAWLSRSSERRDQFTLRVTNPPRAGVAGSEPP